jgi:hypothetical protein
MASTAAVIGADATVAVGSVVAVTTIIAMQGRPASQMYGFLRCTVAVPGGSASAVIPAISMLSMSWPSPPCPPASPPQAVTSVGKSISSPTAHVPSPRRVWPASSTSAGATLSRSPITELPPPVACSVVSNPPTGRLRVCHCEVPRLGKIGHCRADRHPIGLGQSTPSRLSRLSIANSISP